MANNKSNIILIGMPGAGKSTVGVILAKLTSCDFLDTDLIIQISQGRTLQEIVDQEGPMALRGIEEDIILNLHCRNHIIATGGSAVYSPAAMTHLKSEGIVFFLNVDLHTIQSRIHDFDTRGLAKNQGQDLKDLFEERFPLYIKFADFIIDCTGLTQEEVCDAIIREASGSLLT